MVLGMTFSLCWVSHPIVEREPGGSTWIAKSNRQKLFVVYRIESASRATLFPGSGPGTGRSTGRFTKLGAAQITVVANISRNFDPTPVLRWTRTMKPVVPATEL
jgi:hypothetical protein